MFLRPTVDLNGHQPFWVLLGMVNTALKRCGQDAAASEFRQLAGECDGDTGMLITLALNYVVVPNQKDDHSWFPTEYD